MNKMPTYISVDRSNTIILVITIILIVVFTILTIAIVFSPIAKANNAATIISTEGDEALTILKDTATDAENTLTVLNAAATKTSQTEDNIFGFIRALCQSITVDISGTTFCKNYTLG